MIWTPIQRRERRGRYRIVIANVLAVSERNSHNGVIATARTAAGAAGAADIVRAALNDVATLLR
jgi:hypothetical protein